MTDKSIRDRVIEAVAKHVHEPAEHIDEEKTLADLGFDSLDLASMAMEIEDGLIDAGVPIVIKDADLEGLKTIGDVVSMVTRKVSQAQRA